MRPYIRVTGTLSSGTRNVAILLTAAGLDVGFERHDRPDGYVDGLAPWFDRSNNVWRFSDVSPFPCDIALIRHPLRVACRLSTLLPRYAPGAWTVGTWGEQTDAEKMQSALRHWVLTTNRLRPTHWVPMVWGDAGGLSQALWSLGIQHDIGLYLALQTMWPHQQDRLPAWSWDEWYERDPEFARVGQAHWEPQLEHG